MPISMVGPGMVPGPDMNLSLRESCARMLTNSVQYTVRRTGAVIAGCIVVGLFACTPNSLFNNLAARSDFGAGGIPVPRAVQVGFINNTPFRAVFTAGSYDQLNNNGVPTNFVQLRLEGNATTAQIPQPCRGVYSVGSAELVRLIELNRNSPNVNITDNAALITGVNFSGAALGDPLEAEPTEGTAVGLESLVGVDFTCERTDIRQNTGTGLILYTFEQDAMAPGGFRIDFTFIAP